LLANAFPQIDIILDGDSISYAGEGIQVGSTLITSNLSNAMSMNVTTVEFDNTGILSRQNQQLSIEDVMIEQNFMNHERVIDIQDRQSTVMHQIEELFSEPLFTSRYALEGDREVVRTRETNLGRLMADSFRVMANTDVALVNGGSIRAPIAAGAVHYQDLFNTMPFGNRIVSISLSGLQIKEILEHSLSLHPEPFSGFLHVSGLTYSYNYSNPVGNRVSNVWLLGSELNPNKTYSVAITSFLHDGGDGFWLLEQPSLISHDTDINAVILYAATYNEDALRLAQIPRALPNLSLN
jgi:5'-nucleotidase / UDP-sugar diphosphatase